MKYLVDKAKTNPNAKAFLEMIGRFESNGDYNVIYGGSKFSGYSRHPQIRIPFTDPRTGRENFSTAAGKYQINYPTWLTIQAVARLPDFSPASQDEAALWLLQLRGALGYIVDGDFENGLRVASKTWASLPGSDSKQPQTTAMLARQTYLNNGGSIA